jgi:Flp pilus assembly protein TadG
MAISVSSALGRTRRLVRLVARRDDGATAVEFGLIALPFCMLLFGVFSVCQAFFWIYTAESGVWNASRAIRTGQMQTAAVGSPYAGETSNTQLYTTLQQQICSYTVNPSDCVNNSVVLVSSQTAFSKIGAPTCASGGTLTSSTTAKASFSAGAQNSVVIVTLCYVWQYGAHLPFIPLAKTTGPNGQGFLIQASSIFEAEPYSG